MTLTAYMARYRGGRFFPKFSLHSYSLDLSRLRREAAEDAEPKELPVTLVQVKIEVGETLSMIEGSFPTSTRARARGQKAAEVLS